MQIERKSGRLAFKVFSISVWILCCAYVAVTIYRTGALQVVSQSILESTSAFVLVIGLYVFSCFGIAAAFAFLVWGVSAGQRLRADIIGVHAITQIAKYLPTNTLHLVGRHAVLRRRGLSDVALLGAGLSEIVLLLLAAVGLAALGASDELATHLDLDQRSLAIMGAVIAALVLIAVASTTGEANGTGLAILDVACCCGGQCRHLRVLRILHAFRRDTVGVARSSHPGSRTA